MSHEIRTLSFFNQQEWHSSLEKLFCTQISWFNRNETQGIHGESTGKIQVAERFLFRLDLQESPNFPAAGFKVFPIQKYATISGGSSVLGPAG